LGCPIFRFSVNGCLPSLDKAGRNEPGGSSGVGLPPGFQSRIVSGDSPPFKCRTNAAAENRAGPAVLVYHQTSSPESSAATRRLSNVGQMQQLRTGQAQRCWFITRLPVPNRQRRLTAFQMSDKCSSSEPGRPSGVGLPPDFQSRIVSGDSPPLTCRTKSAVWNREGPVALVSYQGSRPEQPAGASRLSSSCSCRCSRDCRGSSYCRSHRRNCTPGAAR